LYLVKNIPSSFKYLLFVYATGVFFFALIRALFFWSNSELLINVPTTIIFKSFLVGLRFDTVILSYILALPVLLFIITLYVKENAQKRFFAFVHYLIITFFSIAFLIAFANIPFYQNFRLQINKAALHWSNDIAFSAKMILQDVVFVKYLLLFVVATSLFIYLTTLYKRVVSKTKNNDRKKELILLLLLLPLLVVGMRGRLSHKSPIRWGTAFFSSYEIANQAALNPVFSFFKSASDNINKPFFDTEKAFDEAQKNSLRKIETSPNDTVFLGNYNVVVLLMESMGSNKTGLYDNGQKLTPHFDSLAKNALFLKNCYSDGIHTFNGLFATLTSFPALPMNKPLEDLRIQIPENAFIKTLKEKNYQTFFFTTHDAQFDNMEGFMRKNGIEHIIGEADFSRKEVLSATGVPDHVLYDKSISVFDTISSPFFALMLSGSDHAPYAIPENIDFKPKGNDKRKDIVAYADWAIGNFLKQAQQKKWFNNTLFVFVGDHGAIVNQEADMYLGMHHTPLVFYAPQKILPEINTALCGQVDILPSIAHLLGVNYSNKPFAVNLFKEERKALSFTYDEHLIGINQNAFYVYRPYEPNLFLINPEEKYCTVSSDSTLAKELRNFSFATMELVRTKLFAGK
jgi:phosphoglycerol transferase MdoB-like AlkP superfamily enzyme